MTHYNTRPHNVNEKRQSTGAKTKINPMLDPTKILKLHNIKKGNKNA